MLINIGTGVDVTIKELAETIQETVGYKGKINWNTDKPDGTPRKLMDVSKLNGLGWKHTIDLKKGIQMVYEDFKNNFIRKL
jgi:GDP-L-fucose synthase